MFANVHVALDDNDEAVGLLEFLEETTDEPKSENRMKNLKRLISSKESWNDLVNLNVISNATLDKYFPMLPDLFTDKFLYSEIGITVRPDLQGKKSGVAEELYRVMNNGILFGWTSNPVVLAQWRKNFQEVIYFPLFNEEIESINHIASLAILYADLLTYDRERWSNYEFGALNSPYFVTKRGEEFLVVANQLMSRGKITELDVERIKYCLQRTSVQGALFGFNN